MDTPTNFGAIRYRLIHLVYVATLVGSSCATFGLGGLLPATLITIFWASVFTSSSRPSAFVRACVITLLGFCLMSIFFLPAVQSAREAGRRTHCANNLKQIGVALHNYHDTYGSFPPAYVANENGAPMHSWRVLILPFIEEQELYDDYHFDEPWDGPNNIKLLNRMPKVYSCPATHRSQRGRDACTSYVAVVGAKTAWPGAKPRSIAEFVDGLSQTLFVVEFDRREIPWLEPKDLTFDDAIERLSAEDAEVAGCHALDDFFFERTIGGREVLMGDGSARYLGKGARAQKTWAAALGVDDRLPWDDDDFRHEYTNISHLKVGNCFRLAIFLLLTFYPLPWVWLGPTKT